MNSIAKLQLPLTPDSNKLTSLVVYKEYGVTINFLRDMILNDFHIPAKHRELLEIYNTHKWRSDFLITSSKEGTISYQGETYIIIYHRCTRYEAKASKDIMLSFRKPKQQFNLPAYVLVKLPTRK